MDHFGILSFKEAGLGQLQVQQESTNGGYRQNGNQPAIADGIVTIDRHAHKGQCRTIHQGSEHPLYQEHKLVLGSFVGCLSLLGQQGIDGEAQADHLDDDLETNGDFKGLVHHRGNEATEDAEYQKHREHGNQHIAEELQGQIHSGQHCQQVHHDQHNDRPGQEIQKSAIRDQRNTTLMEHQARQQAKGYPGHCHGNTGQRNKQEGHQSRHH